MRWNGNAETFMRGCCAVFHKQLGDVVLLQPALARLGARYGAPVTIVSRSGHAPLLDLMPGVRYAAGFPGKKFEALVSFDVLHKSAWRSLLIRAGRKTCIIPAPEEVRWFHHFVYGEVSCPALGDRYVAEYFWDLAPAPADGGFRPPRLERPPAEWRPAGLPDSAFLLVNPTSGWKRKRWKADRWAQVIHAVRQETGLPMIMTSAQADWQAEHCAKIARRAGDAVQSLSSTTTLKEYLWLCANARMVLTVDGAASHLAAASGVKNLVLFGPTNAANWHWPSSISRALLAPAGNLKDLPAESVIAAALDLWRS